eukprot:3704617-Pyramimonas_sp.AAC.1
MRSVTLATIRHIFDGNPARVGELRQFPGRLRHSGAGAARSAAECARLPYGQSHDLLAMLPALCGCPSGAC